ncbi:MAG TPA: universal stress protein [Longimicrobiales bacterium]|nr:universal stress protein [Longimicrobiales bacterium]
MRVLLGIDGSRCALAATRWVCDYLAQPGRQVDLVHVLPLVVRADAAVPRHQSEDLRIPATARLWLDRAEKRLQSRGFRTTRHVRRGLPAQVVPELAAKGDYELVVVGAKGRSNIPFLPTGSVALAVLEYHVPANVVLVREPELQAEQRTQTRLRPFPVLFATDGSSRVESAARSFFRLFSVPELRAIAVAVAEPPEPAALVNMDSADRTQLIRQLQEAAGRWAREAKQLLARPGVRPQARVLRGRPATAIREEANRSGARLIVLGSRGARGPSDTPLGSVALQVARFAPCSVLIVRER